jgi:hypothetical protein
MTHEFPYGKFLKTFILIFSPALIALFVWVLFQSNDKNKIVFFALLVPVSLAMIALMVYCILDVLFSKFTIEDGCVTSHTPIGTRSLLVNEIRGYRQDKNYIWIIPIDTSQKKIKISNYVKGSQQIVQWLDLHYYNLATVHADEEEAQILQNEEFGITEESRLRRLNEARKVSKFINGGAYILLVWMFAFPRYCYEYGIIVCAVYPLIAIFVTLSYRGLISADEYGESKIPSLATSVVAPGIMLGLRALMDFTIVTHPLSAWIAVGIVSITFSLLYVLPSFKTSTKPMRYFLTTSLMIFLNLFYSYGLIIMANCMLDNKQPAHYETTVADKRISSGKTTSYYVDVNPVGPLTEGQEVKVSRDEYESIHVGDTLGVTLHNGYINIPWIEIGL